MPKPSYSFPRLYKNKVEEEPGWNEQVLKWCQEAAQEKGLQKSDYWGGFVIDEMKIQVRVVFNYITVTKTCLTSDLWVNYVSLILRNLCS